MRKFILFILIVIISSNTYAQWDVSASMGLDFKSMPLFRDYINMNFSTGTSQIPTFKSAVAFSAEADYKLAKNFAVGIEYNLQLDSYNGATNNYEIAYTFHRPSLLAYYIIPGNGYQFKLGGGVGYRSVSLRERIFSDVDFKADGLGLVLKAEGNTMLANHFFALIGGNIRYDSTNELANGSQNIINRSTGDKLNLSSISFGIYLGITFTF
jgi:hypothetical protein